MDRLHLRGYKELLNEIKELSGSSELTNQLYHPQRGNTIGGLPQATAGWEGHPFF